MNSHLVRAGVFATGLTLLSVAAATASPKIETAGNLFIADNGGISPSTLPRHGKAPVTAIIEGEVGTLDGTHPPAVRDLSFDVDRTIGLDAVGLPTCRAGQIEARNSADARRACPDAIVGSGRAEVEVAFEEQKPFSATGPMVLFNGGVHGGTTTLLLHTYVAIPAPTAIVVKATVTRIHSGRFGLRIEARIPKIAGGAASVTRFLLRVGRRYVHRGQKKSLLTASCPSGSWMTKGHVLFDDGTRLGLSHVFPCTPRG